MKIHSTRLALLSMLAIGAIWGVTVIAVSTPISTAQVGVPYSSSCTASGGTAPYTYSISAGALPGGLAINSSTGAIAGTPTTAGQFSFTCFITDSFQPVLTGANPGEAAARSGGIAKAGSPQATASSNFTITVASAPSPTPVPPSIWMAAMGLAGAGLARRRQMRRG